MNNYLKNLVMSNQILVVAIYYCALGKDHVCYCEQDSEALLWAHGAISECCPTAYVTKNEMEKVDPEEFEKKHYKRIEEFHNEVKKYEDGI